MEKIHLLIDRARDFIKECVAKSNQMIGDGAVPVSEELLSVASRLMYANNLSSDSAMLLVANGRVWDASILLRSVIEGTAKYCYILSAQSQEEEGNRINEYHSELPRREMGSIEQCVANMSRSGDTCEEDFANDPDIATLMKVVGAMKPKEGEGAALRQLQSSWDFFKLSNTLKKTCPIWNAVAIQMEFRYAMCNALIHKTDTGCGEIADRMARNAPYRDLSELAHCATILTDICILLYLRTYMLTRRFNSQERSIESVIVNNKDFFMELENIKKDFDKMVAKEENQK